MPITGLQKKAAFPFIAGIALSALMHTAFARSPAWAGWYGGVSAGRGTATVEQDDTTPFLSGPYDARGGLFGATLGYNGGYGRWIPGVEADFSYARISGSTIGTNPDYGFCGGRYCASEIRALATVRGRLGYEWHNLLPYVTGGFAYAKVHGEEGFAGASAFGSGSTWIPGWTLGAGLEGKLNARWSFKGEYLYVGFDNKSIFTDNIGGAYFIEGLSIRTQILRFGVNYHF